MKTKKVNLKNILWKEGKYYVAQCLNVDVSSFGKTKTEAIKNLREALDLYFEDGNFSKVRKINCPVLIDQELQYA
ncbi:type II toxin-antitoxin system HicB family antitoxin [Candidatus Parcubacteria bacterium]|nr:MAG: type II toxin-antitoxin system HicB family antitoxin [Candidatus Parcubacteria bacterium]